MMTDWNSATPEERLAAEYSMSKNAAAVALGKLAKGKTSEAKAAASRANGRQGGRPKGSKNVSTTFKGTPTIR